MSEIYGHRELGFFFRLLLEIDNEGITYKSRRYVWTDIVEVKESQSIMAKFFTYPAGLPAATIKLRDGRNIRINGRTIEKHGKKPRIGFLSDRSDALDELLKVIKSRLGQGAA